MQTLWYASTLLFTAAAATAAAAAAEESCSSKSHSTPLALQLLQVHFNVTKHPLPILQNKTELTRLQHEEDVGEEAPNRDQQARVHKSATSALHHSGAAPEEGKVEVPSLLQSLMLHRQSMSFSSLGNLATIALSSLIACMVLLLAYCCWTAKPRDSYHNNHRQDGHSGDDSWEHAFLGPGGGYHRRERQRPCC